MSQRDERFNVVQNLDPDIKVSKKVRRTILELGPERGRQYLEFHLATQQMKSLKRDIDRCGGLDAFLKLLSERDRAEFTHHLDNFCTAIERMSDIANRFRPPPPPPKWILRNRATSYGITVEHAHQVLEEQGYACAICHTPFESPRALRYDHNHETGRFRGFLCQGCNTGIGQLRDHPAVLVRAAEYLAAETYYGTDPEELA